jgi:hypothetical protein
MRLRARFKLLLLLLPLVGPLGCQALEPHDAPDDAGPVEGGAEGLGSGGGSAGADAGSEAAVLPVADAGCPEGHMDPAPDAGAAVEAATSAETGGGDDGGGGQDAGGDVIDAGGADACTVQATTTVSLQGNADANDTEPTATWDPQDPSATSNFSASEDVYDSLGGPHTVTLYFVKEGYGLWYYHALANGSEVTGGTPGQNVEFAAGVLTFDTSAALMTDTASDGPLTFDGAAPQTITFDLGTPISEGGSGLDGLTDYAMNGGVSGLSQDGRICW